MKPYVIRRLRPSILATLIGAALIIALVPRFGWPDYPWWMAAVVAAFAVFSVWRSTLFVRIDSGGVRLQPHFRGDGRSHGMHVPWSSIHDVVLTETDPPTLEVRLKRGAPLPPGLRAVIHDPSREAVTAPGLAMTLRGADRSALAAAVEGFGHVPLRSA